VSIERGGREHGDVAILVIEDDAAIRDGIRSLLEDEGYRVLMAADGYQAIELAIARTPALVILDIGIPILDGYEVARQLRAAPEPHPPILVLSADGNTPAKAQQVGAYAYMSKPFNIDDLLGMVRIGLQCGEP
jgi:DNA-binding response OmpR family regulator